MARSLCRRECFRHLSCYAMATLAAHDPEHGAHLFFARVRTPCGHSAQVIVEGRESQSDGGENNKDHNKNQQTTNKSPQAASPPSCSLSSVLGETGETRKNV